MPPGISGCQSCRHECSYLTFCGPIAANLWPKQFPSWRLNLFICKTRIWIPPSQGGYKRQMREISSALALGKHSRSVSSSFTFISSSNSSITVCQLLNDKRIQNDRDTEFWGRRNVRDLLSPVSLTELVSSITWKMLKLQMSFTCNPDF